MTLFDIIDQHTTYSLIIVYDGYINVLEVVSMKHGTDEYEITEHSKRVNNRLRQLSSG
jgi:hypothetical protein